MKVESVNEQHPGSPSLEDFERLRAELVKNISENLKGLSMNEYRNIAAQAYMEAYFPKQEDEDEDIDREE